MRKLVKTSVVAALLLGSMPVWGQGTEKDLYDLSLEELMNLSVVSASKQEERLRDAPVAIYAVSREEIIKAGALSIPEALRLVPGVIVRETTNGNYDVHLRGFDNTARYTTTPDKANSLTLVMINNRPVFNYNIGGTFWESLPIDLSDVERIEVVLGPSAPLFGPNAVTGVINIITRSYQQQELLVSGQLVSTFPGTSAIGSLAIGKSVTERLSLGLSGNFQQRQRLDDEQYIFGQGEVPPFYVSSQEFRKAEVEKKGLDPEASLRRQGVNGYATYVLSDKVELDFSGGWQSSQAQKVLFTSVTPLTYSESSSLYGNLSGKVHGLSMRLSYLQGEDELHKLSEYYTTAYTYNLLEATAEYDLRLSSKLRLRPALNYQTTTYSDLDKISDATPLGGLMNAEQSLTLAAASLRADYTLLPGLRLIGSARMDKFDVRDDLYTSYQVAATYALGDHWTFRAVHGISYSGMFYNYAFIDATIPVSQNAYYRLTGNQEVDLTHNTLSEVGARVQLRENLQADLTLFTQKLEDVIGLKNTGMQTTPMGVLLLHEYQAMPYTVHQNGATLALKWMPGKQWQLQPFVSVQRSELRNFDYHNNPNYTGKTVKHESTPAIYGGWTVNYAPAARFNLNTSAYFMSRQHIHHQQDLTYANSEGELEGRLLINARASYRLIDKLSLQIGAKNLLDQQEREHYATDRMGRQIFGGISYNL
ncbi:TonB-dependent receptor plug domain-containing protein [Cesiribacter andamanensis]|uniref:Colicin I receptor n=1 Tax=Cesiribacter andamanensis AMV16 TaxID=1279009 RepID=M7NYS5_9BACT|nr:TonB-dependent receptor [Cesiribacter andamanensis]EMR03534.1 Colicin I receptor precursor [Cesiribacter andamanensis AMV16]